MLPRFVPEKRRFLIGRTSRTASSGQVVPQCPRRARIERDMSRLEKLGVADREESGGNIDVADSELSELAETQACAVGQH